MAEKPLETHKTAERLHLNTILLRYEQEKGILFSIKSAIVFLQRMCGYFINTDDGDDDFGRFNIYQYLQEYVKRTF